MVAEDCELRLNDVCTCGKIWGVPGSAKKSEGEKASGLPLCSEESAVLADEGAFLRTGRIHGGRFRSLSGSSRCAVSKGILVTRKENVSVDDLTETIIPYVGRILPSDPATVDRRHNGH